MLSIYVLVIFCLIINLINCQTKIRIGIVDDNQYSNEIIRINISNINICNKNGLNLELHWINTSNSSVNLLNKLEFDKNFTNIYLTYTNKFATKLTEDFCQINSIPFISMKSYQNKTYLCSITTSFQQKYYLKPNILQVLISYLKYNSIEKVVYIYDNNTESMYRIYELLKLMNTDEYFNNFSLDIRKIYYEDIYTLLYNIESHFFHKNHFKRYILLDLYSYQDYENMFEKILHMGLTSNSYYYIILSTFDACLWMNKLNFTGRLIFFDYEQSDCLINYSQSLSITQNLSKLPTSKPYSSYYRSTLSFRNDIDSSKSLNLTLYSQQRNISLLSNNSNLSLNFCNNKNFKNEEYFSYSSFYSQLSKSSQFYSRNLYNTLNLIIQIYVSNLINCKTFRLKTFKSKSNPCYFDNINIYQKRNQFNNSIQLIGYYSTINKNYQSCSIDKSKSLSNIDRSFSSRIYYITSLFDEPFLMLRKGTDLYEKYNHLHADINELRGKIFNLDELEGFCVDLAGRVCSILNITCRFRIVEDGHFGSQNSSTGTWDGMVGDIVSRKADMAIGPLTISQKRMEVVDFSKPFMNLGISIMIRKPDKQKPGVFSFMNPVSMEIWLCLSLAYVAVSAVLFLTSRVVNSGWRRRIVRRPSYRSFSYPKSVNDRRKSEIQLHRQKRDSNMSELSSEASAPTRPSIRRRYHYRTRPLVQYSSDGNSNRSNRKKDKSKENSVHLFGISNALFFSFASFMRQPINLVPKSLSGRIAATSWWYFSLIFISSYTANLVAFLTIEQLITPIDSVEDLAKQYEIKYGLIKNGTTASFFEKSNITVFQHMWAVMQQSSSDVFIETNDEGVAKVRNSKGKYAFIVESTKNEYVNERLPCDTMKVGSDLDSKGYGIATRLGSDLTEAINIIITNLRETGFLEKLKQLWWYDRSECSTNTKDQRFSQLSLSSVTGLFYIFLFGIILSLIIVFMEFIITAKNESETLNINFREIIRIKMIENMIGITINTQRQLEFGTVHNECNYQYDNNQEDEIIKQYTAYQLKKPQSDV